MSIHKKFFVGAFLLFIYGIGLLNVLASDRAFSERENRPLAQMPEWTLSNFYSGKLTARLDTYMSDQFLWKDGWVKLKAMSEWASLKQENNGVFFGKDGFLIEPFEKPGVQFDKNMEYMKRFAANANGIQSYVLLAPTSIALYEDKLPLFAQTSSERDAFETAKEVLASEMEVIDVYDALKSQSNEHIYFKTDHHWTMRGAYLAYKESAEILGIKPYKEDDFNIETVAENFYGTLHSKTNTIGVEPDKIDVYLPKFETSHTVTYEDGRKSESLYEWDYLNKKDKYSLFLDGNHALVKIETGVRNGRKLAVVKDSYAHAFIPFLTNHFEEIHVLDLRYYHSDFLMYLNEQNISEVLFLYNVANFAKDPNVIWLSQSK
ncbi:DHHW family protein [Sporosarcina sp. BP05]|uniref:DHHW family protein n=1 Tax=Sporosarcina sp. BP05 TaxID=2758726 RepID=UPI00164687F6|nr:DHHW family protein [Sporosarcina sp. BP05]